MKKIRWEYKQLSSIQSFENVINVVNRYGNDGWELVAVNIVGIETICFLKREKNNADND